MNEGIIKLISLWVPFLVLVGAFYFLIRRASGGSSFQSHCKEHMAAQTETQKNIAHHLDRIATALEKRP